MPCKGSICTEYVESVQKFTIYRICINFGVIFNTNILVITLVLYLTPIFNVHFDVTALKVSGTGG